MEIQLLKDILSIFALSIAVILIFHRLRLPVIVGFLLTGVLAGPSVLGLVKAVHEVEILAEIGVILLLFTIGIEFSLKNLLGVKTSVFLGGSLQVALTILAVYLIVRPSVSTVGEAVFIGFLVSLSSTAIVLKALQERAEIVSPHGSTTLAILIFQDIIIVPMILFVPILAGTSGQVGLSLVFLLLKALGVIALTFIVARQIMPWLLHQVARTRSRELFVLSIVAICFAVAWLTASLGLSLALGAFLAGLIISESEYSHHAFGNILPFRDLFTSFFFVSIGMLLDVRIILQSPAVIILAALAVLILKAALAKSSAYLLGLPLHTAILVGLSLGQIGEFSFVLSGVGIHAGLISENIYQIFLAVSILTMAATPFVIAAAPGIAGWAVSLPLPKRMKAGFHPVPEITSESRKNHLVIVGYGVNGRNVARAARIANIPYVIIEMNPDTVRRERTEGEPIFYGDAAQEAVLLHADIKFATVLMIAIPYPAAAQRITQLARVLNAKLHIIVRTRYLQEMQPLYDLGADEVIPEEFETSVEIFARVLAKYLVPRDEIERLVTELRADGYGFFRRLAEPSFVSNLRLQLPDEELRALHVCPESPLVGKTLAEIEFRKKFSATVLAIKRGNEVPSNPAGDDRVQADDLLYVLGSSRAIAEVASLCREESEKEKSATQRGSVP